MATPAPKPKPQVKPAPKGLSAAQAGKMTHTTRPLILDKRSSIPQPLPKAGSSPFQVPKRTDIHRQRIILDLVTCSGEHAGAAFFGKNIRITIETSGGYAATRTINGQGREQDLTNAAPFFSRGVVETNLFEALAAAPLLHPILAKPLVPAPGTVEVKDQAKPGD